MIHNKSDDMIRERFNIPFVKKYIIEKIGFISLRDSTPYEQKRGIDLVGITNKIDYIPIEVKIRYTLYNGGKDILFETWSKEDQTLGWMGTPDIEGYCKSDLLVYVWKVEERPIFGYIFDLNSLRTWWRKQNENDFVMKPSKNIGYITINRVVNISQIPIQAVIHSDFNQVKDFDDVEF